MNKNKMPDMDEMIEQCKKKQRPDEEICFALGVGRMIPLPHEKKAFDAGLELIKSLDGFQGVNPVDLWHNALIFDTLNNGKAARNILKSKGMGVGQVVPVLIEKRFLKNKKE